MITHQQISAADQNEYSKGAHNSQQFVHAGKTPDAVLKIKQSIDRYGDDTPDRGETKKTMEISIGNTGKAEFKPQPKADKERTENAEKIKYKQQ